MVAVGGAGADSGAGGSRDGGDDAVGVMLLMVKTAQAARKPLRRPALHVGLVLGVVTGTQLLQSLWCIRSWVPQASQRPPLRPRKALGTESVVRDVANDEHWLSFSISARIVLGHISTLATARTKGVLLRWLFLVWSVHA